MKRKKAWSMALLDRTRSYRYSQRERRWLESVLSGYNVPYHFSGNRVETPLSSRLFKEVVKDAACLRETTTRKSPVPYVTWNTFCDPQKKAFVVSLYGGSNVDAVLLLPGDDRESFKKCFGV